MIDDIAKKIMEEKNNLIAQAFTMQIGNLLISNGIVPIMKEYTLNDVKTIIDSDRYKMIAKFGVAFDELDTTEHDKRIISDVIDYVFSELNRLHISYDSEENSVRTTYYDGTDDETTIDIVKGILKENFAKEIKEQNNE